MSFEIPDDLEPEKFDLGSTSSTAKKSQLIATLTSCFLFLAVGVGGGLYLTNNLPDFDFDKSSSYESAGDFQESTFAKRLKFLGWLAGKDTDKNTKKNTYGSLDPAFGRRIDYKTPEIKSPVLPKPTISW